MRVDTMDMHLDSILDGSVAKCAAFLRAVHLKFSLWFKAQEMSVAYIPPPAFEEILDRICEETWVPVNLPAAYLQLVALQGGRGTPALASSRAATMAASAPILAAMAAPAAPAAKKFSKTPASSPDPWVKVLVHNFNIKKHISAFGEPPKNEDGGLMCLSYHVCGSCCQECDRGPSSGTSSDISQTPQCK